MFAAIEAEQEAHEKLLPIIRAEGEAALRRLFEVAHGHSGQCRYVAAFLLGCYDGPRFPFVLTSFRALDRKLIDDCIAVLRMDAQAQKEVHLYFQDGGAAFEKLAVDWNIRDYSVNAEST